MDESGGIIIKKKKQLFLLCLVLCFAFFALPASAEEEIRLDIYSQSDLMAAVEQINSSGGDYILTLADDVLWDQNADLELKQGNITLLGGGHTLTIGQPQRGICLSLTGSAVLNLGEKGQQDTLDLTSACNTQAIISANGNAVLNMYDNVTLRDSNAGGQPGGVLLAGNAVFNMYGGTISNCTNWASVAGGVMVSGNAVFNISGGLIEKCGSKGRGGAVMLNDSGAMNMSGGIIEDCHADYYGGAVLIASAPIIGGGGETVNPSFKMTGGIIRKCTAKQYGGGVCLYSYEAVAELSGGEITGCSAGIYGGGLANLFATMTVGDIAIHNNSAVMAADDMINYSSRGHGVITFSDPPAGLKLDSTGKGINGWYDDGGGDYRWTYDPDNPDNNYLVRQQPVTEYGSTLALKAAHGAIITISYELAGGHGEGYEPQEAAPGETVQLKPAPEYRGYIFLGWSDGNTLYQAGHEASFDEDTTLTAQWIYNGGGQHNKKYILHYDSNGGTFYNDESYEKNATVDLNKIPVREGYVFTGWYADEECTQPLDTVLMDSNRVVYAGWRISHVPAWLNTQDHVAYIIGYIDGLVYPEATLTRAQTATIFFRLLKDDIRQDALTDFSNFADVNAGDWYNTAVATMAALNIVQGYPDGNFYPDAAVSRAEFAAVCARFDNSSAGAESIFSDVLGHWAMNEISLAAANGWISGYNDGSFHPDSAISRCEAAAMINRVLERRPETADDLLPQMKQWPDNQDNNAWYYLDIQEAGNSHLYSRRGVFENWTSIISAPDWAALEK